MKAWIAHGSDEDWCMLVHGETASKAKVNFIRYSPAPDNYFIEFIDVRVRRLPGLDNKPITYENAKEAGFEYTDDWYEDDTGEGLLPPEEFTNECQCVICKPVRT